MSARIPIPGVEVHVRCAYSYLAGWVSRVLRRREDEQKPDKKEKTSTKKDKKLKKAGQGTSHASAICSGNVQGIWIILHHSYGQETVLPTARLQP